MNKITFIPVGGLANRMRAIASVIELANRTNSRLEIVWIKDWALNAPFCALYKPICFDNVILKECSAAERLIFDRPRRKNLYIPSLFHKLFFRSSLYERSITPLYKSGFSFDNWVTENKSVYLASYTAFMDYDSNIIDAIFKPNCEVEEMIAKLQCGCKDNIIGVHIRRTDNLESIKESPTELFFERMDMEIERDGSVSFFLATDSQDVKREMQERYGERVIFSSDIANRGTLMGIQGGLAEMYLLARTRKIYGSSQSSFSCMASQISGTPLEIVKK